jgi:hypothetical protein
VDSADMNKSVNQFTYVDGDQCVARLDCSHCVRLY